MFVLIFCDFCGFISIAYTTLIKLLAVFFYGVTHFSAKRGIAIACRLSVCDVGEL